MRNLIGKTHDLLSRNVLLPMSRAQRRARSSRRPVMIAFDEGMKFRKQSEHWSDDQKCEWMLNRLRFVARRAYRDTSYYRDLFDSVGFDPDSSFGFDDYARLPLLER